jgi:hypothetical protein
MSQPFNHARYMSDQRLRQTGPVYSMTIQYLQRFALLLLVGAMIALVPVSAASPADQTGGSLTRGSSFTVTLTGLPNTAYYIWLAGTFTMTGEPGDQPPVIAENTLNLVEDPPGGPYTIGSYKYSNGGGRTILDDVAPSTPGIPNTNYYALVTTDETGVAVVEFLTSRNTALRSFSVRAENPQSVAQNNLQIEETLFSRTAPGPMIITPTEMPATATITPLPTLPPTTTVTETVPPVPASPPPTTTPARHTPLETGVALLSVSGCLIVLRRW